MPDQDSEAEPDRQYRRTPGDALRPDTNAPTTAEGFHRRPSARAPQRPGTAVVPVMPFAAIPANMAPWERGARENDREWALFVAYRDQAYPQGLAGPMERRNIARLARELGELPHSLQDTARQYNWVWRAAHWDRDVDARKRELARTELERTHIDHARIRGKMRQLAENELDKLCQLSEANPAECAISPRELAGLLKLSMTQDQLAAGLPTANDGQAKGPDYGKLDYEELKLIRDLMRKAGGQIVVTTGEDVTGK